jgi:hypothetical protein
MRGVSDRRLIGTVAANVHGELEPQLDRRLELPRVAAGYVAALVLILDRGEANT